MYIYITLLKRARVLSLFYNVHEKKKILRRMWLYDFVYVASIIDGYSFPMRISFSEYHARWK